MTSFNTLIQRIDSSFLALNEQIKVQHACPKLAWCVGSFNQTYYSSYHYIDSFGTTNFQRTSNYLFGSLLPVIRDKFISSVIDTLRCRYYEPLTKLSYSISDRDLNLFLLNLDELLFSYWHQLRSWSFSELFSFLNKACLLFNDYLDLETDLYKNVKQEHFQRCLTMYQLIRDDYYETLSLQALCYLSIRANWLDCYLEKQRVDSFLSIFPEEINDILDNAAWLDKFMYDNPYIDFDSLVYPIMGASKHILYELDNHGEFLFDLLLIEYCLLQGHTITIAAKGAPILNDITYNDLLDAFNLPNLNHLTPYIANSQLTIINNGSGDVIPLRYLMSDAYINAYQKADLVIMKGQGNFESFPLKRSFPLINKKVNYLKDHIYLFGLKSSFSQRSFSMLKTKAPIDALVCHASMILN
tara:strand:+ start:1360 stop:2598 length:1239 start_codon:yes stop_codon:yes gene_type:complete